MEVTVQSDFIRKNAKIAIQGLALLVSILITAVILVQQSSAQTANSSLMNKSPEEIVFQMRDRLNLTEDQEKRISPIIQESCNKRIEILNSSNGDRKAMKSASQQVQWTTDIKLGQILTKKQMEEYQNLLEEQGDKTTGTDTHRGKGGRGGGLRGF
jgi:hypothetical protein